MKNKKQDFEKYAITHEMMLVPDFLKRLLNNSINFNKKIKILDYGCGDGGLLEYFSKYTPKKNLYGVEVSRIRVNKVKKKGFNCEYIDKNYVRLRYPSDNFDVVTMIEVIEHIPKRNIGNILKEINRVLKPGGKIICTTPNYSIKRVYDLFMIFKGKNIAKVIRDDPTHVSKYNFNKLYKLLRKYFKEVKLYPNYILMENKFKFIKKLREKRKIDYFSHKIVGLCKK